MELSERFEEAFLLANQLHAEQKRKGTSIPYISHLIGVASLVMEDGGDEDEVISALLHDAVEDQGGKKTLELIRDEFGNHVARIVEGCTDSFRFPNFTWIKRKERHLEKLADGSPAVIRVALADKLYNARSLTRDLRTVGKSVWDRFNCTPDQMLWYYNQLVLLFQMKSTSPNVFELNRTVMEMDSLMKDLDEV